jgi:hypothetical protein
VFSRFAAGSGKSYTAPLARGERKIGSKVLSLDATCGYISKAGRGHGHVHRCPVTGSADMASAVTPESAK